MSKTSRRRQAQVPEAQVAANWTATFGEREPEAKAVGTLCGMPIVADPAVPEDVVALCAHLEG